MINKNAVGTIPELPDEAAERVNALTQQDDFRGVISYEAAQQICQASGLTMDELMLALVPLAQQYAIPPVSNYKVGAVGQGFTTGSLYYGANMEYEPTALSFCVHAEQSVTTNAWLNAERGLSTLAISAVPCGYCRQFLYETSQAQSLRVLLPDTAPTLLADLLPDAFGPKDLGVDSALMEPQDHKLSLEPPPQPGTLAAAALDAANQSYSPYSFGYAGVALNTSKGNVFVGRYAENAAFNPSMSPLEGALTMWALAGDQTDLISAAVLVQCAASTSQAEVTATVLGTVSSAQLEILQAH